MQVPSLSETVGDWGRLRLDPEVGEKRDRWLYTGNGIGETNLRG